MFVDKTPDRSIICRLADEIGDVNGEEIAWTSKSVHRFQIDVVCIDIVGFLPAERSDGFIRGGSRSTGLGADNRVFPVRLIPNRDDLDTLLGRQNAGTQLRFGLMSEPVSYTD